MEDFSSCIFYLQIRRWKVSLGMGKSCGYECNDEVPVVIELSNEFQRFSR